MIGAVTTLGVVFRPQFAPELLKPVAVAADESGLAQLWLWEDFTYESGIATAAAALGWTERVRVCVGVLPVPLRNVVLSAMEVATLDRLFPGRSVIGFGHGVQKWMGQAGVRPESPVTLLREYLVALRRLLSGERVTTSGRYVNLDNVRLKWPPETPPTILAGAIGPKSLKVCGEESDGVILTASAGPDGVRAARELVGADVPITVSLRAAIGDGAQDRIDGEKTDDPDELGAANDDIPVLVERLVAAGASTVVLQPTPDEPDLPGLVRYAASLS
jgi:alkanesulfonate monooxygenase SsuD/methylene tetrahydromethanopterin reductase-like flavin-dependent oxidoreductase (luciferase family)